MDIVSLLGTILGTILKYRRDPHVHCEVVKIDSSSYVESSCKRDCTNPL